MARHDEGFFSPHEGVRLSWASELPEGEAKAHLGLIHGFGEYFARYQGTTEVLVKAGIAVHGYDHRGHGLSDGRRGHIDAFHDYVDDLERFFARLKTSASGKPVFLLGHSLGGLIAAHFLARQPEGLKGAVLSSPFMGLAFHPPGIKVAAAHVLNRLVPWLPLASGLKVSDLTRDEAWQASTSKDPQYGTVVSSRWFFESLRAQQEALQQAPKVRAPLLVFAGTDDGIASPAAGRAFFDVCGSADKQYKAYPGMRHECLNEVGKEEVQADIVRWISAHL